jgi:hypothetical protein
MTTSRPIRKMMRTIQPRTLSMALPVEQAACPVGQKKTQR